MELQLPKQEQLILLRLRITGQDDHPIVRRGQFDIDHLHGGEFFEHDPRRQSRRQRLQPLFQRDQQTIGQKRNENMGFDSGFELVIDRTDRLTRRRRRFATDSASTRRRLIPSHPSDQRKCSAKALFQRGSIRVINILQIPTVEDQLNSSRRDHFFPYLRSKWALRHRAKHL